MDINFTFFLLLFTSFFVYILMFYIPGQILCNYFFNKKYPFIVYFGVGIGLWGIQSYFLHYLKLSFLSWGYILIFLLIFIYQYRKAWINLIVKKIHLDYLLCVIIIFGMFFQLLAIFPSGLKDSQGIWFYNVNASDGVYYAALGQSASVSFPPNEPGLANNPIKNFHYLSAIISGDIIAMFHFPAIFIQFHSLPILLSFLYGSLAYLLGFIYSKDKRVGYLFCFFAYFGADLGYLLSVIFLHTFSITALGSIESSALLMVNPPRAMSEVVFLSGVILLFNFLETRKTTALFISGLVLTSTIGFKIYTGIFSALLLTIIVLISFIHTRRYSYLVVLIVLGIIGLAIFLPPNIGAGGLVWDPLAWPRHYYITSAIAPVTRLHLQEQVFVLYNNIPRLLLLHLQYILIFLVSIFGIRLIGILNIKSPNKESQLIHYSLLILTTLFIFIGLFFTQKTGAFNIFNFFSFSALILSLFTANFIVCTFAKNKLIFLIVTFIVMIGTLPRPLLDSYYQFSTAINKKGDSFIFNNNELAALSYMKDNSTPNDIILVFPGNRFDYKSPYVYLFTQRQTFYSNINIIDSHNYPKKDTETNYWDLFNSTTQLDFLAKAKKYGIKYVYIKTTYPESDYNKYSAKIPLFSKDKIVLENADVTVLKID